MLNCPAGFNLVFSDEIIELIDTDEDMHDSGEGGGRSPS